MHRYWERHFSPIIVLAGGGVDMLSWGDVHKLDLPWEAEWDLRAILVSYPSMSISEAITDALAAYRQALDDHDQGDDDDHRGPDHDRPAPPPPPGDVLEVVREAEEILVSATVEVRPWTS
jgi:hypothetical protein